MSKIVLIFLAVGMLVVLAGCGGLRQTASVATPAAASVATTPAPTNGAPAATTPRPTRTSTPLPLPSPTATPWPTRGARATATSWLSPTPTPAPAQPTPTPVVVAARPAALPGRLALQLAPGGPIYVIGADGQGLKQVTTGLDPAWSPDGTRLAVARLDGEQRGVWVMNADGSGAELLYGWSQLRWPAWTSDGKTVVFARQYGGKEDRRICFPPYGCFTIPGVNYWRLGMADVADRSFRDTPSDLLARSPAPRADGTVFYIGERGIEATTLTENTNQLLLQEQRLSSPALAPDGKRIVYMAYLHDHYDLFIMNADGANPTRLTRTSALEPRQAQNVAPAWSPDGQRIAFLSDRDGAWRLYIMNADGSDQRPFLGDALAGLTFTYAFADEHAIAWGR